MVVGCVVTLKKCFGGHSGGETPGLIPNPEAKPSSADGTALVRVWESRTPPDSPLMMAHPVRGVGHHSFPRPTPCGVGLFSYPNTPAARQSRPTVSLRDKKEGAGRWVVKVRAAVVAGDGFGRGMGHEGRQA